MANNQIVHKVLFGERPNRTIALLKVVDKEKMELIKFFVVTIDKRIDEVELAELRAAVDEGLAVEFAGDGLQVFLEQKDYVESDLLGDDELSLAVALR